MPRELSRWPWLTTALAAAGLAIAALPQAAESLQYEREAVEAGAYWRLLTGQLAHWTPRMAATDLLVTLAAGAWLELRSRRLLLWTLAAAALFVGGAIQLGSTEVYRGCSGIASGLFVALALLLFLEPGARSAGAVALACLAGFAAKTIWELTGGAPLFAGGLPDGVALVPAVHLAGALAASLCVAVDWYARRDSNFSGTSRTR